MYNGLNLFADNLVESGDTWALLADMINLYMYKYGYDPQEAVTAIRRDLLPLANSRRTPYVHPKIERLQTEIGSRP